MQRKRQHNRAFDFHKRRQQIIWGTEKKKNKTKRFLNQNFTEKEEKKHPAALINAHRKQSSRFALMRSSFHVCYFS